MKDESGNPTGSFTPAASLAVSMAMALGADVCLPSAGNAGARWPPTACGGLKAHVCAEGKPRVFIETEAYGAEVTVSGLISDAGKVCAERAKQNGWYECATLKEPYRVEGKKTMATSCRADGMKLPDAILYPTGGGTGSSACGRPSRSWRPWASSAPAGRGCTRSRPRLRAHRKAFEGLEEAPFWENAQTLAHGLRVPKALGDFLILRARREPRRGHRRLRGRDRPGREGRFPHRGALHGAGVAAVAALRKLKSSGHGAPTTWSSCSTPVRATSTSIRWRRSATERLYRKTPTCSTSTRWSSRGGATGPARRGPGPHRVLR